MQADITGSRRTAGQDKVARNNQAALLPASTRSVVEGYATAGPHARPTPVVVMLGLFWCCRCQVSAVMVEGTDTIWLDLITNGGRHTNPLATITGIAASSPRIEIESRYRDWADRPEIRWHLTRETALLYRTYLNDRDPSAPRRLRPSPQSSNCPEAGGAQIVWREGE